MARSPAGREDRAALWCCVTGERPRKTQRLMEAIARGWGERTARIVVDYPPNDYEPFILWGHLWHAEKLIPPAIKSGRPRWFIDNGWFMPAKGEALGYYRITYRGLAPVYMADPPDMQRNQTNMLDWREKAARGHSLLALPGDGFGKPFGFDLRAWAVETLRELSRVTDRPVLIREKGCPRPLRNDFAGAWAVVTHSSAVGVEAVLHGLPVFVHPWSAAAPVGNLSLANIEAPAMPDNRRIWWQSLMCQQFTIPEMAAGLAFRYLAMVREQWERENNVVHL